MHIPSLLNMGYRNGCISFSVSSPSYFYQHFHYMYHLVSFSNFTTGQSYQLEGLSCERVGAYLGLRINLAQYPSKLCIGVHTRPP